MDPARAMPNHPESERSVLGAMLRSREAALLAVERLRPEDFYDPANREIYSAMQFMAAASRPIDLVTLDEELTRRGKLESVGGAAYLVELLRSVPSASNVQAYIRIVDDKSTLRKLIRAAETILTDCYAGQTETQEIDMSYNSGIHDLSARADFDYTPTPEHCIKFGGWFTHHIFTPEVMGAKVSFSDADTAVSQATTFGESKVRAQEISLYVEDDWSITEALKVNAGVALTGFSVEGTFYPSVQPRLSGRLMLSDDLSLKAGYAYMTQYMHLLSTSNVSLPTDLWVPVTRRIPPMNSHQVALGAFYNRW
jgi:hypothetical protein